MLKNSDLKPPVAVCARVVPRSKALINCRLIIAFALLLFSRNTPESNDTKVAHGPKVLQMGEKVEKVRADFHKFSPLLLQPLTVETSRDSSKFLRKITLTMGRR